MQKRWQYPRHNRLQSIASCAVLKDLSYVTVDFTGIGVDCLKLQNVGSILMSLLSELNCEHVPAKTYLSQSFGGFRSTLVVQNETRLDAGRQ